ncbi:hypothetical protein GCM10027073_65650 [Streptomyces chlorus]
MQSMNRNTNASTETPTTPSVPEPTESVTGRAAAPIAGSIAAWSVLSGGEAVIVATTKLIAVLTIYVIAVTIRDALTGRVQLLGRVRQAFNGRSRMLLRRRRNPGVPQTDHQEDDHRRR